MESEWSILVLVGLWVVLNLKRNPLHPRTPPSKSAGLFDFIFPFLSPHSIFYFFLSFCSNFSTTSSSASATASTLASATTSSLASAQYSIRTNYVTILIQSPSCKGMNVMMDVVWYN